MSNIANYFRRGILLLFMCAHMACAMKSPVDNDTGIFDMAEIDSQGSNGNCSKLGILDEEGIWPTGTMEMRSIESPLEVVVENVDKCSFSLKGNGVFLSASCATNKIKKLPFEKGDVVNLLFCEDLSGGFTTPLFISIRTKDGQLLFAGSTGSQLTTVKCLPPEISITTVDAKCPSMSSSDPDDCGKQRVNYGLKFQTKTSSVELWTGDSGTLALDAVTFGLENFYSYKTEGTGGCTDAFNPRESWLIYKK